MISQYMLNISLWVKTKKNENRTLIWKETDEIVRREKNEKIQQKQTKKKTSRLNGKKKTMRWREDIKRKKKPQRQRKTIIWGGCVWRRKQWLNVKRNRRKGE